MDFIVEKATVGVPVMMEAKEAPEIYDIKTTKMVKDVEGNDITIVDDTAIERTTVVDLQAQKARLQEQIKQIDAKLLAISKL